VKIYVVAVEELRRKERQGETQKTPEVSAPQGFLGFIVFLSNVLFCRFLLNLTLFMTKLRVPFLTLWIT
jgi:hypothetical protein